MQFGGVGQEVLKLNEATFWSGGPREWDNADGPEVLKKVREAIAARDWKLAERLCKRMQGPFTQGYLPLGDVRLTMGHGGESGAEGVTNYRRWLDLDTATSGVRYTIGGATYEREVFVSREKGAVIVRLTCDKPGRVGFVAELSSLCRSGPTEEAGGGAEVIGLSGRAPAEAKPSYLRNHPNPIVYAEDEGMAFEIGLVVKREGGSSRKEDCRLIVEGADAVTIAIAARTGYRGHDRKPSVDLVGDAVGVSPRVVAGEAVVAELEAVRAQHVVEHQGLYRRVELDLGTTTDEAAGMPTDQRLRRYAEGAKDHAFVELCFQYGRYLLITCSRPGGQPANLQGIWNDLMRPPWSSNYTININTQMNYWPAEVANLSECHEPLLEFVRQLSVNGAKTAAVNYGARGWCSHHNSDVWRQSAPVGDFGGGDPMWANFAMSGPWLSQHLWERYAFVRDEGWLREVAWPVMKGAAEFCLDWLIEDGSGNLVTSPSCSPEIRFKTAEGQVGSVSAGTTMDRQIVYDHFTNCLEAAEVLGVDDEFVGSVREARKRILPLKVGARGNICEWAEDWTETDVHHRHVSHLFGLHPGRWITPETPELFAAARKTLDIRGDAGTGWSLGWKINFWARLRDGGRAHWLVRNLLRPVGFALEGSENRGGGYYPNLFDAHEPFQIDGNFALTAGVAEMLLQSHLGSVRRPVVELLPAVPPEWPEGKVKGLRARGGVEVSMEWKGGRLVRAELLGTVDGMVAVRYGEKEREVRLARGERVMMDGGLA